MSAVSTTGEYSAASTTGDRSAASTTGEYSAASTAGEYSAASTTGYRSAASTTGYCSAAFAARSAAESARSVAIGRWVRLAEHSCHAVLLPSDSENWQPVLITHAEYGVGVWVTMTNDGMVTPRPDVLLPEDGRGYLLRYDDKAERYLAGCRTFTAAEAVAHWSNPTHPAPQSAARLLAAVREHIASMEVPA